MGGLLLGTLPMIVTGQVPPVPATRTGMPVDYVIVSVPAAALRPRLAEVVRLSAAAQIAVNPSSSPPPDVWSEPVAPTTDDDPAAAVVAAHEQRIAILKRRLAAAGDERAAAPRLADLRARLRRAEAARSLAMHRLDRAAMPAFAERHATSAPAARLAGATGGSVRTALAQPTGEGGTAHRLAQARRSLANARAILTTAEAPPIALAGLMTWPGSDRWSLADVGAA